MKILSNSTLDDLLAHLRRGNIVHLEWYRDTETNEFVDSVWIEREREGERKTLHTYSYR